MGEVTAVVVGIEKYALPGINIAGPYSNAIRVAAHLTAMQGEQTTVGLFVNRAPSSSSHDEELDRLNESGVTICQDPTKQSIMDHFAAICHDAAHGSGLFIYWCGHGFVSGAERVLLCSDFSIDPYADRNWNATQRFLSFGRRDVYSSFAKQIFFADVCARATSELDIDNIKIKGERFAQQLAVFATQEGEYSKGAFSEVAISWLERQNQWPDIDTIINALQSEFAQSSVKPFTFYALDNAKELEVKFASDSHAGAGSRQIEVSDANSTKGAISFSIAKGMTFHYVAEFLGHHVHKNVRLQGFSEGERLAHLKEIQLTYNGIREALGELGALALGITIREYEVTEKGQQFILQPVAS